MAYKVIIMPPAKRRLDFYVQYTLEELKNKQAAKAILADARETKKRLSQMADSLKICDDPLLAKYEYRKISFLKHRFLMIYRICDGVVIVDGMFHESQDYEGIFASEMKLGKGEDLRANREEGTDK
jgi:hypothetical protein